MTNFYFRAVASDGQIRTGAIHAESERLVAFELRRQGLTPVYVGKEAKEISTLRRHQAAAILFRQPEARCSPTASKAPDDDSTWSAIGPKPSTLMVSLPMQS
jgi:hypothetical protein